MQQNRIDIVNYDKGGLPLVKLEREYPLKLKKEEALIRGLPPHHKKCKKILRNIQKGRAGFRGEKEVDYHLSFLPEEDYYIFQNLTLSIESRTFQMDHLVLSPWFTLIIESKNIYGHLYFDPVSKQLFRTYANQKEGFPDPILQVKRQMKLFQKWVSQHMVKPFPIYYLVAIGHPGTIVETKPGNEQIFEKVIHAEHLPDKIEELARTQNSASLSSYQLRKLSELLIAEKQISDFNIWDYYKINPSELQHGVPCPACSKTPMKRYYAKWKCVACGTSSQLAHKQVIEDYILLTGSISNEKCRQLLVLDSRYTARRILHTMNLKTSGQNKNRTYTL